MYNPDCREKGLGTRGRAFLGRHRSIGSHIDNSASSHLAKLFS
jgi:hypothetical protein